jgi:hypothetical protein
MDGSTSAYVGACRKDIPYPSVSHESVPSLIDNLVSALYGSITKTVVNRRVVWNIPCDPNNTATINNIPRNSGEGLLCYIIRALNLTGGSGIVTVDGIQTLTNKTLTAPVINNAPILAAGSTTARTLENRFADVVNVKDFGAVGDGVTDDTAALKSAVSFASSKNGGAVFIPSGMNLLIDSDNIILPSKVGIYSEFPAHGSLSTSRVDAQITLNPSYTIRLNDNGSFLKGLTIIRKGLTRVTNPSLASAALAQFTGTGVTLENTGAPTGQPQDCYIGYCHIHGFNLGIKANYAPRFLIEKVYGDNINAVTISNMGDYGRISECHFWPYYIAAGGYFSRSGIGFDITNAGATVVDNCFSFGHAIGYRVTDSDGVHFVNCHCDADGTSYPPALTGYTYSIGYSFEGTTSATLVECHSDAHGILYNSSASGNISLNNCWGFSTPNYHVYLTAGYAQISSCNFYNSAVNYVVYVGPSVVGASINQTKFNTPTISSIFSIDTASKYKVNLGNDNFYIVSGGISSSTNQKICSRDNGNSFYVFGGSTGTMSGYRSSFYASQGTASSPAGMSDSSDFGSIAWNGYEGTSFIRTALIRAGTNGTPTTNSIPTLLVFSTAGSSGAASDKVAIDSSGNLRPSSDNSTTLGTAGIRWASVWAANGTIQTSDERTKNDIQNSVLGLDFINSLRPVSYKFNVGGNKVIRQVYRDAEGNEVDSNTDGAIPAEIITEPVAGERVHYGLLAQEVKAALPEGTDFGGWILTDKNDPNSEQGLRYEEFIAPLIQSVKDLKAIVDAQASEIADLKSKLPA